MLGEVSKPFRDILLAHNSFAHPDEFFFSTLNYNPKLKIPGSCLVSPSPSNEVNINFLAKYVIWGDYGIRCGTKMIRAVCILGIPHISKLQTTPHLFANKFHADFQPEAYDALEKWYFEKWAKEIETGSYSKSEFDPSIYANRTCSHYHI